MGYQMKISVGRAPGGGGGGALWYLVHTAKRTLGAAVSVSVITV